jgi:glycosyltransferase involved in cell wall biosynthesis
MSATVAAAEPTPAARARPLRVAHINANFFAGAGGITLREALAVDQSSFSNTILAPHDPSRDGSLFERARDAGLGVVHLERMVPGRGVSPRPQLEALRELAAELRAGEYDIVHTHGAKCGFLGRVAAHRVGIPAIVHTLHGFPFHEFHSRATRTALVTMERRLGRITDYFLSDGTFVASEAIRLRIAPADRIRALVSPIVPVPPVTPERRREARRRLGLPEDVRVVGTVARLAEQKAPLDMVEAFAQLDRQDVCFVWIGGGELRAKTEEKIRAKGLEHRFLLLGERDDVPSLLPGLDVFALSSRWEGLPCSALEAMTCGIPVVANAVNSVPEIVIAGRTGIVTRPSDPESLARGIAFLLDHPRDAARMAAAARDLVAGQFGPDALGDELAEVYEAALRAGSTRRGMRR